MSRRRSTARKGAAGKTEPGGRGHSAALYVLAPALVLALIVYYLLASRTAVGEFGLPLDDSWIHVRFAQHLAQGQGFSFNPGEPTSTTTGALWTVFLSLAYRVTHEFLFTSIALNGILCVLLCLVVYHLSLSIVPSPWLALAAGLTVAVTVPLPWWALSGMEPPLYATLAVLGILLHVRLGRAGRWRALLPTVVFAVAGLARPECLLLFPLALLDRLIIARWVDKQPGWAKQWAKKAALQLPVFALVACPPFIHNYLMTGLPLPSSFYSKQQWTSLSGALASGQPNVLAYVMVVAPARQLWSLIATWASDNAVLIAPFFVGLIWIVREVLAGGSRHRSLLIPMALVAQPVVWALVGGYRPADYQSQRYVAGLNPLFLLVGLAGGRWVMEQAAMLRARWVRGVAVAAVLAASLARQPAGAAIYAQNVKNITEMQVAIGRWVRDHVPRGSLLAVNDVGAIGVIADDPVFDLQGLVTPEVLPLRSLREQAAGRAPALLSQYLFDHRPDYLIMFPEWYPELDARRDLFTPLFAVQLEDNITSGRSLMVVYQSLWAKQHGREARR